MFENDWILSSLSNPTLDIDDLVSIGGLNTKNTQFLSKDQYLKSNFIKDNALFKDTNGSFSREKFDKFYEIQASRWRDFQNNEFPTGIELDAFDTASNRADAKVKDSKFTLGPTYNPDRVQIGVEGWRTTSKRTKSEQELAQSQKIFNPETGEYENTTPEDYALFSNPIKWVSNLFKDPLVLAQYEEDEVDEQGNKHKKGEYKLNPEGTYYYEKLNGRSPLGKTVLSAANILTKEDSALNKIDFFDSDDLEKSTAGVIAKNIALIAPMFTPAAPYYYKAIIAKELTKTLPMLHSVVTNLFGSGDNQTPKWMNRAAAVGESLSATNSVWSSEHTFSFENLANLISDVALQWGQQKQIAKAVNWFGDKKALKKAEDQAFQFYKSKVGGSLKGLEAPTDELWKQSTLGQLCMKKYYDPVLETMKKKQRLGADLALAYMALISNTDVYSDMLERGATKKEAAWVALGSTAAMFSVDRFAHLGEVFYDDLTAESIKQGRQAVKKELKDALDTIYKPGTKDSPGNWYKKGAAFGKRAAETFVENLKDHNLGGVGKALGEGLEEVSEELVTDLTKATYSLLGDLGMYDKSVKDTGAFENMLERYSMSLLGGTIGGGLFYGVEKYKGFNKTRDKDLVTLINEGKAQELRNLVKGYVSKGKAGNTKISGTQYSQDAAGNITWLSTDKNEESQNQQVGNRVIEKINSLEAAIVGSGTKLSQDQLFDKMVLQEARYQEYKNASHVTGYYQEFSKLQNQLLQAKETYNKAAETADGTLTGRLTDSPTDAEKQAKVANLQPFQTAVDNAQKRINDFLSGDMSLDYTRKLNFALDPVLNSAFLGLDRTKWVLNKIDPTQELTIKDQIDLNNQWNDHVKEVMLKDLDKAFLAYKAFEKTIAPQMLAQQDNANQYKSIFNSLSQLYNKEDLSLDKYLNDKPFYTMDSRLVDQNGIEESEEEYNARNNTTTPDEIQKYYQRQQKVFDLNNQVLAQYIQQFDDILRPINYSVDSSTNRTIVQNIRYRLKDIIKREMQYPFLDQGSRFDASPYRNILSELREDLSNIDDIQQQLQDKHYTIVKEEANKIMSTLNDIIPPLETLVSVGKATQPVNIKKVLKSISESNIENKEQIIANIESARQRYQEAESPEIEQEAQMELYNAIPIQFKTSQQTIQEIFNGFGNQVVNEDEQLRDVLTIDDVIKGLNDPTSSTYQYFFEKSSALPEILNAALQNTPMQFGKDSKMKILVGGDIVDSVGDTVKKQLSTLSRYTNTLSSRIQKNPVYSFYNKLKVNSHSPLENILSSITKEMSDNQEEIFNMNYILDQVYKDYVAQDKLDAFELNDTQSKQLDNAQKALELMSAYIYSASTSPDGTHYFGQNKQINEFANSHRDVLTREWEPLPEISQEYAQVLQDEVNNLNTEIEIWKRMSENNSMNKLRRLVDTESIVNRLHYELGKNLSFQFTVGDKQYDLSEGLDSLSPFDTDNPDNQLSQVFQFEQTLYSNFNKILKETGWTPEQFFDNSDFWKKYLGSYSELEKQQTSKLNESLSEFTKYDKALYLLSILSDNPSNYYKSVQNFIKDNEDIAPLTVQQNISRLGEAAHTKAYKAGFKALAKLINPKRTVTPNVVYINGVAGAGKTEVVLRNIRQRFYEQDALVIGPTTSQAVKLQNSLNEGMSYTIDGDTGIFSKLLPEWDNISESFQKAVSEINKHAKEKNYKVETDYFVIQNQDRPNELSGAKIDLKVNKIKFNPDITSPLIFVDEAAHMNTLQIALLDEYADRVGGTVFLASDSNQSGYQNGQIENLKTSDIFATRTSKLQESLRTSNVQKQNNNNKVSALLDTINDIWEAGDSQAWSDLEGKLPNLIRKLNLRVYNKEDDINGDLIGGNIDEVIKTLLSDKHKNASIGFIGDANSPAYQKLKDAGFTNLGEPLTETIVPGKKFMQGQEFDYVIIDNIDLSVDLDGLDSYKKVTFLKRFYTLMSRGKTASIFLDRGLAGLVGANTQDDIKSIGFSLANQVQLFRDNYSKALENLDLSQATQEEVPQVKEEPEVKQEGTELVISPVVDNTPEFNPEATIEQVTQQLEDSKQKIYNDFTEQNQAERQDVEMSEFSDLLIEANTVVPITGLQETMVNPDGTERRYPAWLPGEKTSVRRNINAIYDGTDPITKRVDKQRYQDIITKVQSSVIFGGNITDPALTSLLGFSEAWTNRKLQLEVRKATDSDNFGIGTDLKPTYIDIDGTPYIVSITCRLDGLSKTIQDTPFSAVFDICLLSDFNNLKQPNVQQAIKDKINQKIRDGKITGTNRAKAERFRDNLSESVKQYEQFIRRIVKEHPEGHSIELSPDMYQSHQTTRLVKRKTPRRLGGTLSVATIENNRVDQDGNYISDYNNFLDTDKRKVVSPVYIVGNKSDILKGKVSESVFGKAVVFVSSNTNLTPEELPDRYIEQKRNPDAHTPEVRMVVLNNHGLSFTELITHRIQSQLTGEGEKQKKPWRMDTLGVRMFTAMWNFRAGLENFISQLDRWKQENGYTSKKILDITKVESELFDSYGKNWTTHLNAGNSKVEALLNRYKVTAADLENLIKFNQEYCKDIPTFRLGIDLTNTNVGGYVRAFDVSNSKVYGKNEANMLAIEEEYAHKYHSVLSSILEQLTANEPPKAFKTVGLEFKPMATRLAKPDGSNYATNEYIGKNEQKRNLSGLIHTNNKNIVIGETDNSGNIIATSTIPAESMFSFFPKAISAIASKSRIYQTNNNVNGLISITTIDTKNNTDKFDFDISSMFRTGMLERKGNDNTLFNMFNLIFHGTVQSLESPHAYTEEAPFKYGIFVDPDLETSQDYKQINVRGQNGQDYAFLRCGTNPVFFDVDVDVVSGGIAINLSKLLDGGKRQLKEETKVQNPIEQQIGYSSRITDEQDKVRFQNYLLNEGKEDNEQSYSEYTTIQNNRKLINFFKNGTSVDNIVELINLQLGGTTIQDVKYENGKVIYTDNNNGTGELSLDTGDMYITATPNKTNSVEEITGQSFNSMVVDPMGADIMTHQDFLNQLEESFPNDTDIQMLSNSSNVESYLELLVSMKDTLNNKIEQLEDSDMKWSLSDYLLYVDTTCF